MRAGFLGIFFSAALLAGPAFAADGQPAHIGPVTALEVWDGKIYSASQAGVFQQSKTGPVKLVAQPKFRVFGMAAGGWHKGRRNLILLAGGVPGESGIVGNYDLGSRSLHTAKLSDDLVYDVAINPDGKWAALACADKRVLVLPLPIKLPPNFKPRHTHTAAARVVAWSPDGKWLASGGLDGIVLLSRADGIGEPKILQEHTAGVESLAWSPDGKWLASGAQDAKVRLHSADGQFVRTYSGLGIELMETGLGKKPYAWALAWGGEPGQLIAATSRGALYRLSLKDDTFSKLSPQLESPVYDLAFDDMGELFVASEGVRRLKLPPATSR